MKGRTIECNGYKCQPIKSRYRSRQRVIQKGRKVFLLQSAGTRLSFVLEESQFPFENYPYQNGGSSRQYDLDSVERNEPDDGSYTRSGTRLPSQPTNR